MFHRSRIEIKTCREQINWVKQHTLSTGFFLSSFYSFNLLLLNCGACRDEFLVCSGSIVLLLNTSDFMGSVGEIT